MNQVEISFLSIPEQPWEERARQYCFQILEQLKTDNCEISLVFTDDKNIAELNRSYRGKEGATDVLSFCQDEGEIFPVPGDEPRYLGDIIVSLDTVERHGEEFGVTKDEDLRRVLIHAVLHLHGWTHETRDPSEPMLKNQEILLKTIGESIL